MHVLPPLGHPLRETFTVDDLVAIATRKVGVMTRPEARGAARRTFADNAAIRRVYYIIMRADDELQLVSFGRRLGCRVDWNFKGGRA